jgi:hypothetical protein
MTCKCDLDSNFLPIWSELQNWMLFVSCSAFCVAVFCSSSSRLFFPVWGIVFRHCPLHYGPCGMKHGIAIVVRVEWGPAVGIKRCPCRHASSTCDYPCRVFCSSGRVFWVQAEPNTPPKRYSANKKQKQKVPKHFRFIFVSSLSLSLS